MTRYEFYPTHVTASLSLSVASDPFQLLGSLCGYMAMVPVATQMKQQTIGGLESYHLVMRAIVPPSGPHSGATP